MLGWMIVLLVCIGYFLNEARRAPVIEDDASDDADEALSNRSHAPPPKPLVDPNPKRPLNSPDQ